MTHFDNNDRHSIINALGPATGPKVANFFDSTTDLLQSIKDSLQVIKDNQSTAAIEPNYPVAPPAKEVDALGERPPEDNVPDPPVAGNIADTDLE